MDTSTVAPIIYIPMRDSHREYVIDAWVKSHYGKWCTKSPCWGGQRRLVTALLERCAVLVAAFDEDPNTAIGWAATSTGVVHFVYVMQEFRRLGIATALLAPYLASKNVIYTHSPNRAWWGDKTTPTSSDTKRFIPRAPETWQYDPYLAFELASTVASYREHSEKKVTP